MISTFPWWPIEDLDEIGFEKYIWMTFKLKKHFLKLQMVTKINEIQHATPAHLTLANIIVNPL